MFAGNEDMHKSLAEFEIRPDATTGFHGNKLRSWLPLRFEKFHRLIMEKMTSSHFLRFFSSYPFNTCRQ